MRIFCQSAPSWLQALEILDVVVPLGDQHALEMLGLCQQHDALVADVNGDHTAVALGHHHQNAEGIIGTFE
jgi:hypothetical protein